MRGCGEGYSGQREEQVQRPWGGIGLGALGRPIWPGEGALRASGDESQRWGGLNR